MNSKTHIRYRLSVALLFVALLCTACGTKQTSPLFTLLAGIPQDPVSQAEGFIYFLDYSAMETAYNTTRPSNAKEFSNLRENNSYTTWWVVRNQSDWLLGQTLFALETMPETVGFSTLDVDQAISFGATSSHGLILAGGFDADAIRTAYQTNLDFNPNDFDGMTVWCWVEGCADGALLDRKSQMKENPFGGSLGMYAQVAMQVRERGEGPQKTEVGTLDASLVEAVGEGDYAIASVRFTGLIREQADANPEPFDEIWHVRQDRRDRKATWLIAGIQQVA